MSKLREAVERVLAMSFTDRKNNTCVSSFALDELKAALSEPDLEGAVVEAAVEWWSEHHTGEVNHPAWSDQTRELVAATRALAAARRPRYEATKSGEAWQVTREDIAPARSSADFYGPDAERHAREWAAKMNREPRP